MTVNSDLPWKMPSSKVSSGIIVVIVDITVPRHAQSSDIPLIRSINCPKCTQKRQSIKSGQIHKIAIANFPKFQFSIVHSASQGERRRPALQSAVGDRIECVCVCLYVCRHACRCPRVCVCVCLGTCACGGEDCESLSK